MANDRNTGGIRPVTPTQPDQEVQYALGDDDWFELQTIMSALHGIGELVMVSSQPGLMPEIRSENMASILLSYAKQGQKILSSGQVIE